jgi:hypothetical protein
MIFIVKQIIYYIYNKNEVSLLCNETVSFRTNLIIGSKQII